MFEKVTRVVLRFPALVLALWLAISLIAAGQVSGLSSHLTTSLTVPGSESEKAENTLNTVFAERSESYITIAYRFGTLSAPRIMELKSRFASVTRILPHTHLVSQNAIGGTLFTVVGSRKLLPEASQDVEALRQALRRSGLKAAQVTGPPAIFHDVRPILNQDLHRGQFVACTLAVILLFLTLGLSWAFLIPLIFAICTILLTLGIIGYLSRHILMVLYIPNIVELIGFGLAVDYSLLAVLRYRQEIRKDAAATKYELVNRTMNSAGKTIFVSSLAVSAVLSTLLFIPVPFIHSLGIAGLLVPATSMLASMTLLPALLLTFGQSFLNSERFPGFIDRAQSSHAVSTLSSWIKKKPRIIFISTSALLLLCAMPLIALQTTPSSLTALPSNLESAQALTDVSMKIGDGVITPVVILVDLGSQARNTDPLVIASRKKLATDMSRDPEVMIVAQGEKAPYVSKNGRYFRIFVFGKHDVGSTQMQHLVKKMRDLYIPDSDLAMAGHIYIGGAPAQGVDLLNAIKRSLLPICASAFIIIYLILFRAFKSLLLPIKAIALDIFSILASLGILVSMMKFGVSAHLLGTYQLPQIEIWVLVFLCAITFGISMDYEIFIVSRIREAWLTGKSNEDAVIEGFTKTIGVVTSAALIFIVAISGFIFGHFAGLQELGIGLFAAILIDATLIRLLLLPSAMILLGSWNWWLPKSKSHRL
jgi:RND superfamily putative drug exporter